jgi:hypothetical protein
MPLKWNSKMGSNPIDFFPDFEHFAYQIANTPDGAQLRAWGKLKECERRVEFYSFVERLSDPSRAQHRILLDDSVSAFLLTFESVLQFLKDEICTPQPTGDFGNWLITLLAYDHIFRGLRTLRHFEAHVEDLPIPSTIKLTIGGPNHLEVTRRWHLPCLKSSDLEKIDHSPLKENHLEEWNYVVTQRSVAEILIEGLKRLFTVLEAGEKYPKKKGAADPNTLGATPSEKI